MKGMVGIRGSSGVCLQSGHDNILSISFLGWFFCSTACIQKGHSPPPLKFKGLPDSSPGPSHQLPLYRCHLPNLKSWGPVS